MVLNREVSTSILYKREYNTSLNLLNNVIKGEILSVPFYNNFKLEYFTSIDEVGNITVFYLDKDNPYFIPSYSTQTLYAKTRWHILHRALRYITKDKIRGSRIRRIQSQCIYEEANTISKIETSVFGIEWLRENIKYLQNTIMLWFGNWTNMRNPSN